MSYVEKIMNVGSPEHTKLRDIQRKFKALKARKRQNQYVKQCLEKAESPEERAYLKHNLTRLAANLDKAGARTRKDITEANFLKIVNSKPVAPLRAKKNPAADKGQPGEFVK